MSISSAVLYENQKPCEYGTQGCHPNMGQMLLSGVQLKVYWPDSKSSYRLGPPGTPEHDQMRVGEVLFRETDYVGGQHRRRCGCQATPAMSWIATPARSFLPHDPEIADGHCH